jgi:hypothetical protein
MGQEAAEPGVTGWGMVRSHSESREELTKEKIYYIMYCNSLFLLLDVRKKENAAYYVTLVLSHPT